jgi:DNA (cytosine-5)-methyltransferase 1
MVPTIHKTGPWSLSDLKDIPSNGYKVFSCFHCGGGSTMGYKLSGYDVLGGIEIDPEMMKIYKANHNPKHSYLMGVQEFNKMPKSELPNELFNLDILDGSPPCSSFSMAGSREKAWGKNKKFREGQATQVLDDLFFHFIETARKLQPKIVVAENVKGLILGKAKGYVKQIAQMFNHAGYDLQLFLLNAAFMGVPQRRERTFFIAKRKGLGLPKLDLKFDERPTILKDAIRGLENEKSDYSLPKNGIGFKLWHKVKPGQSLSLGHVKTTWIGHVKCNKDEVCHTLNAGNNGGKAHYKWDTPEVLPASWWSRVFTYPNDFNGYNSQSNYRYLLGMSVPPYMMNRVSKQIELQWLKGLR